MEGRLPRRLAALLYADVAGYSRLTGQDEDATHRRLTEYLDLISATVHPLWAPIIVGEIVISSALILVWLYMAYRFFTKKTDLPKWYIGIAVFSLIYVLADAFAVKLVLPNEPVFDPDTIKEVARSVIMVVIWVPYMLVSKRVKATFIK